MKVHAPISGYRNGGHEGTATSSEVQFKLTAQRRTLQNAVGEALKNTMASLSANQLEV